LFVILGAWPCQFPDDPRPRIGFYFFPSTWVPWNVVVNLYILLYGVVMIGAATIAIRTQRNRRHPPANASPNAGSSVADDDPPTRSSQLFSGTSLVDRRP